jgi:cation transporter-like permease
MLTATAMGGFEEQLATTIVLALFVPSIISSGGNAGSQASTLVIRAMALGEVTRRDDVTTAAARAPSAPDTARRGLLAGWSIQTMHGRSHPFRERPSR